MSKIKLGIIGIGNMGSAHIGNILSGKCPEIEVTAVADRLESRRNKARETLGKSVQFFCEGDELIENGNVDAVLIAVPHYDHPTLAIKAFEKGINVMCEKPAGVYTKQVREMNQVAENSGKVFGMMFNQRTNELYRKMKKIVSSGELGEIRRVNWIVTNWFRTQYYYDSGDWRATWNGEGGGVLLNQCPHNIDLLQWICGMPTKVSSFMTEGKWHDIEVEDDVSTFMEFENGATGVFITTTGEAPGTNRFEIILDGGKMVCENGKLIIQRLEEKLSSHIYSSKEAFSNPKTNTEIIEPNGEESAHSGVLNAFAANILRGEALVANGKEGINGLMLSNAMHLSSWLNKTVSLPIDEDLFLNLLNEKRKNSRHKAQVDIVSDTGSSY